MAYEYTPIPRLTVGAYPLTPVQPFTRRDGLTYAIKLDLLIKWINKWVEENNASNEALYDAVIEQLNTAIDTINEALQTQTDAVNQQLADQDERVNNRLAANEAAMQAQQEYVDNEISLVKQFVLDAVQQVIDNSIELQDDVLAGLIQQLDSDSRTALDALYLNKNVAVNDFTPISDAGEYRATPIDVGLPRLAALTSDSIMAVSTSAQTWSESVVHFTRAGSRVYIDGMFRRSQPTTTLAITDIGYITGPYLPAPVYGGTVDGEAPYVPGSVTIPAVAYEPQSGMTPKTHPATIRVKASGYIDLIMPETRTLQAVRVSASYRAADYPTINALDYPQFEGTNFRAWMTSKAMVEGVHYDTTTRYGIDPRLAVVNIHGGSGEAGAQEVAVELANATGGSLYYLDMRDGFYTPLHMSSNDFDDPRATGLVRAANRCISMHGAIDLTDWGEGNYSYVGGLDADMRSAVIARLRSNGFPCVDAAEEIPSLAGTRPENICNLGVNGGVQIEMSTTLRRALFESGSYPRSQRDKKSQIFYDYVGALVEAVDTWISV